MRRTTGSIPTRSSMRCARASSRRCTWQAASPSAMSPLPSRCLRILTAIRSLMRPSISWNTRWRGTRPPSSSWSATTGLRPATTLSRLENACQFHRYLVSCWTRQAPDPPYIGDVAALEIAWAKVDADPEHHSSDRATRADRAPGSGVRRCPHVILLRCAYDIRPIFEAPLPTLPRMRGRVGEGAAPVKRDAPLVVALPPGSDGPQVFEVAPAIFDLLAALNDWTDPEGLDVEPDFAKLVADLVARGLVEVSR